MWFFGLFRAKMAKIGIQNPKLIVPNDYQQFLAYFDWFLSIFQISDVKPELLAATRDAFRMLPHVGLNHLIKHMMLVVDGPPL